MPAHAMPPEIVTTMIDLYNNGASAREIAIAIYETFGRETSRGSVIGILNRNKDRVTKAPQAWVARTAETRHLKTRLAAAAATPPDAPANATLGCAAAVAALTASSCRWPIGHPSEPGFHFCCARRDPGSAYCAHHRAMGTTTVVIGWRSWKRAA